MSLYIVLERDIEGLDAYVNGHALGEISERDADVCEKAGVKSLMTFFSMPQAEATDFLEGEGLDPSKTPLEDEAWFPADEGLNTLGVLQKHFGQDADVAMEIGEWQKVLQQAKQEAVRWHLAVDY
jgi:hypothetical protein